MVGREIRLRGGHGGSRGKGEGNETGRTNLMVLSNPNGPRSKLEAESARGHLSDAELFDIRISGRGSDTSFDDVLYIVVPYATYGSSDMVAYGAPRLLAAPEPYSRSFATIMSLSIIIRRAASGQSAH